MVGESDAATEATSSADGDDPASDAPVESDAPATTVDSGGNGIGAATAGSVFCGGTACTLAGTPGNTCCVGLVPFPTTCLPTFPGCVNAGVSSISCDDAADCDSGKVCCGSMKSKNLSASCAASCDGGTFQVCRTNAECGGGTCEPIQDMPDYGQCK